MQQQHTTNIVFKPVLYDTDNESPIVNGFTSTDDVVHDQSRAMSRFIAKKLKVSSKAIVFLDSDHAQYPMTFLVGLVLPAVPQTNRDLLQMIGIMCRPLIESIYPITELTHIQFTVAHIDLSVLANKTENCFKLSASELQQKRKRLTEEHSKQFALESINVDRLVQVGKQLVQIIQEYHGDNHLSYTGEHMHHAFSLEPLLKFEAWMMQQQRATVSSLTSVGMTENIAMINEFVQTLVNLENYLKMMDPEVSGWLSQCDTDSRAKNKCLVAMQFAFLVENMHDCTSNLGKEFMDLMLHTCGEDSEACDLRTIGPLLDAIAGDVAVPDDESNSVEDFDPQELESDETYDAYNDSETDE